LGYEFTRGSSEIPLWSYSGFDGWCIARVVGSAVRTITILREPFVDAQASTCLSADPGSGPSFGGEHRPFEWGWRAVGLCSPCLRCSGGGCAGGGVPLGAVPVLSWCGEASLGGKQSSSGPAHPHPAGPAVLTSWRGEVVCGV